MKAAARVGGLYRMAAAFNSGAYHYSSIRGARGWKHLDRPQASYFAGSKITCTHCSTTFRSGNLVLSLLAFLCQTPSRLTCRLLKLLSESVCHTSRLSGLGDTSMHTHETGVRPLNAMYYSPTFPASNLEILPFMTRLSLRMDRMSVANLADSHTEWTPASDNQRHRSLAVRQKQWKMGYS